MNDNELFTLVRSILLAGLAARGQQVTPAAGGWDVARKFQPVQQGANSAPTVYVFKIGDKRHGSPQRKYEWDDEGQRIDLGEFQQYETTFQASIEMDESTDPAALTPSDAANLCSAIMQSDEGLASLEAAGVGIYRIPDVRNPYNVNDRNRYDANPSFDFVLTYRRTYQGTTPAVTVYDGSINRV